MGTTIKALLAMVVLAAIGAAAWILLRDRPPPPPPPGPTATAPAPAPAGPRHPVPEVAPTPLPALDASDPAMGEAFASVLGARALERFVVMDGVVRRIVATVDNLPREQYAVRLNPVRPTPGTFATTGRDDTLAVAPANAKRYAPFVALVDSVDAGKLADIYLRHYPLFQQAYVELGYPQGHFNDRLVEVIDHLLQAPDAPDAARLAQPHVLYEYADPELEAKSAGEKAMMRLGHANAARVKAKLMEIRARVAAAPAAR